jgi:hypothetical protein
VAEPIGSLIHSQKAVVSCVDQAHYAGKCCDVQRTRVLSRWAAYLGGDALVVHVRRVER